MQRTVFNEAQLELLKMMEFVKSKESLKELQHVIALYFAEKAKSEMERMWQTGEMNEEKFESFRELHERTPYSKVKHAEYRS